MQRCAIAGCAQIGEQRAVVIEDDKVESVVVIVLAAIGAMFNAYGAAWRVADYRKSGVRIMLITLRGA